MIGGIFYAFDACGFDGLVAVGEFFDALIDGVFGAGEALWVAGSSGTARADLSGIVAEFVGGGLIIAFTVAGSFVLGGGHCFSFY